MICVENSNQYKQKTINIKQFRGNNKPSSFEINIQNSIVLLYPSSEWPKDEIKRRIPLIIAKNSIKQAKHLRINF
jgi:hypothetical protein